MTLDPTSAQRATVAEGTGEHHRQVRLAALASTVGTTIEWYDDDDTVYERRPASARTEEPVGRSG